MPKSYDWFWSGTRKKMNSRRHLYYNEHDGWVYTENMTYRKGGYEMRAACHETHDAQE
jgi:hypothetical protein